MQRPSNKIICSLLKKYPLNGPFHFRRLRRGIENLNFLLVDSKRRKYVLRIYQNRDVKQISFEMKIMRHLEKQGIPVPHVLLSDEGNPYLPIGSKWMAIFSYIEGKPMPLKHVPPILAFHIGCTIAKMQQGLQTVNPNTGKLPLHSFSQSDGFFQWKKDSFNTKRNIPSHVYVNPSNLKTSKIHGDITMENILVKENKVVGILDFDDVHYDYVSWDTATALTQLFVTKTQGIDFKGMQSFLNGYLSFMDLNQDERSAIIPFMKQRTLEIAGIEKLNKGSYRLEKDIKSIKQSALRRLKLIEQAEEEIEGLILTL